MIETPEPVASDSETALAHAAALADATAVDPGLAATPGPGAGRAAGLVALSLAALGLGYLFGQSVAGGRAATGFAAPERLSGVPLAPPAPIGVPAVPDDAGVSVGVVRPGRASLGEPAPAFDLPTPNGGRLRLSDLAGRPVVVNFWATWCGPCQVEMPVLQNAHERHAADGLAVVGLDVQETADLVLPFLADFGLTFPIGLDETGNVAYTYGVSILPTTYFVGRDGRVAHVREGMFASDEDLAESLRTVLVE